MQYKSFYWLCGKDLELILSFSFRYALPDFGITNVLFESKTVFLYKTLSDRREYDPRGKVFKKMCLNIFSRNDQPCTSLRKSLGSLNRQSTGNGTNQLVRVVRTLLEVTRLGKIVETHQILRIVRIIQFYWASCLYHVWIDPKHILLKQIEGIMF